MQLRSNVVILRAPICNMQRLTREYLWRASDGICDFTSGKAVVQGGSKLLQVRHKQLVQMPGILLRFGWYAHVRAQQCSSVHLLMSE